MIDAGSSRGLQLLRYWCAEHPAVKGFRWDHDAWGSSWSFLVLSVSAYLLAVLLLSWASKRWRWRCSSRRLGPIPAVYNFALLAASAAMFVGACQALAVEIQEIRWLYRRRRWSSPLELIVCLPLGTRPAGRIFFWSYVFYLSKYYEFLGTFILLLQKQPPQHAVNPIGHAVRNAMVVFMCFLWLYFSQSLQILALLTSTGFYVLMYAYFFLWKAHLAPQWKNIAYHCHIAQYSLMALGSLALVGLHFGRYGCSGIQSWFFGSLLDLVSLPIVFIVNRSDATDKAKPPPHPQAANVADERSKLDPGFNVASVIDRPHAVEDMSQLRSGLQPHSHPNAGHRRYPLDSSKLRLKVD